MTTRDTNQHHWTRMLESKVGVYLAHPKGSAFDLVDIDRVEAAPCSCGMSSGHNATSGTINITTNGYAGECDGLPTRGLGMGGAYMAEVVVSVPMAEDNLAARLAVQRRQSSGCVENANIGQPWNGGDALKPRWSMGFMLDGGAGASFHISSCSTGRTHSAVGVVLCI